MTVAAWKRFIAYVSDMYCDYSCMQYLDDCNILQAACIHESLPTLECFAHTQPE